MLSVARSLKERKFSTVNSISMGNPDRARRAGFCGSFSYVAIMRLQEGTVKGGSGSVAIGEADSARLGYDVLMVRTSSRQRQQVQKFKLRAARGSATLAPREDGDEQG